MTEALLPIDELLYRGKIAANNHDNGLARQLLSQVVQRDPRNEQGWLWLSGVVDEPERIRYCLKRVLAINPENVHAATALRDFDQFVPKALAAATPAQAKSQPLKPARPTARPRPTSMIEGAGVQSVLQQQTRTMWAYIMLWSSIASCHLLLFKAGQLRQLSFGGAASRVFVATLLISGVLTGAWFVGLTWLERRLRHQTLSRTAIHAAVSNALWLSAVAGLAALIVGALGVLGGSTWASAGNLGRIGLVVLSLVLFTRDVMVNLIDAARPDRAQQQQVMQSLLLLALSIAAALVLGWIIAGVIMKR